MEELSQRQQYELAFHLLPSFTEAELDEKRREIEETISKSGGLVSRYGEIKKMRLAYPIRKEKFSNFGYLEFFASGDALEKLNKELLASDDILRHLVIKKEETKITKPRRPKIKTEKPKEERALAERPSESGQAPTEGEGQKTEELDKKIEEILEKL